MCVAYTYGCEPRSSQNPVPVCVHQPEPELHGFLLGAFTINPDGGCLLLRSRISPGCRSSHHSCFQEGSNAPQQKELSRPYDHLKVITTKTIHLDAYDLSLYIFGSPQLLLKHSIPSRWCSPLSLPLLPINFFTSVLN